MHETSRVMNDARNRTTKMVENQIARIGGLRHAKQCRWSDGTALKNARPGRINVWMKLGTVLFVCRAITHTAPRAISITLKKKMQSTTMGALLVHRDAEAHRGSPLSEAL